MKMKAEQHHHGFSASGRWVPTLAAPARFWVSDSTEMGHRI
jgi:hypothetical protein